MKKSKMALLLRIPGGKIAVSMVEKTRIFIRYSLVGGICAVIDYMSYFFAFRILNINYLYAVFLSLFLSGGTAFVLHKYFTFQNRSNKYLHQITRFAIVVGLSTLLNVLLMYIQVSTLGIYALSARIITILIMWPLNFLLQKYITFHA